jgi:hypothetical protein
MKNVVYILVGDAFIPNRIFFDEAAALSALKNSPSQRYVLVYVPNKRKKGESKLVARYIHKYDVGIVKEALWVTEDTDYGFICLINPLLCNCFEFDEYDDIVKWDDNGDLDLITNNYDRLPDWIVDFVKDR